mgnify:CR=1 FL=1
MLAHDCARSGTTPTEIRPPFGRKWYRLFPDEGLMSGIQPVIADGKVFVKYQALLRSRYEHYLPFLNVGYLDTATGHITPIMDQSRTYGWHDSLLLVHDEQCQLSAAGRVLINTHQGNVNAMDLDTLQGCGRTTTSIRPSCRAWRTTSPATTWLVCIPCGFGPTRRAIGRASNAIGHGGKPWWIGRPARRRRTVVMGTSPV